MDYKIRKIKESEYSVLGDFLYEAIFIPEGVKSPPREITNSPNCRCTYLISENIKGTAALLRSWTKE